MTGGAWRIGRIGGIQIGIDPSWSIIAVLITFNFWSFFSDGRRFPELGSGEALVLAVLSSLLFFLSVLAHELAHATMCRLRGIPVSGITLFLFGGATHARVDARGPVDEFLVTVVGPATSGAVGGLLLFGLVAGDEVLARSVRAMLAYLGVINVTLAVFNLLPGFPLDGGRLLRSALWRATGDLWKATRIAARVGQGVGLLIIAGGVGLVIWQRDPFELLWPAFIGWFLFRAATSALQEGERRKLLRSATAADVMSAPPPVIPADATVSSAFDRFLIGHEGEAFPVVDGGRVVGFISPRMARQVPGDRVVREAMVSGRGFVEVEPADTMDVVAERLGDEAAQIVLVLDRGQLVGVIEHDDLARFLGSRGKGSTGGGPAEG